MERRFRGCDDVRQMTNRVEIDLDSMIMTLQAEDIEDYAGDSKSSSAVDYDGPTYDITREDEYQGWMTTLMQATSMSMDTEPGFRQVQAQPPVDSSDTEDDPWFGLQSTPALQHEKERGEDGERNDVCLLYTSPSPRDRQKSRMPSSA